MCGKSGFATKNEPEKRETESHHGSSLPTVEAGVFYVFYNWVLLERGASPLMAQDECAVVVVVY